MPKIEISFETFSALEDFPIAEQQLIQMAQEATAVAYAPYSNFWVGVALLLSNGEIVKGANQENAAYPSGLCAERVAFFHVGCSHPAETIISIAVVARKAGAQDFTPAAPCGACRQVMLEYEAKQNTPIKIIFMDTDQQYYALSSVASLLPFRFDAKNL